jgi:hypothetical protein
MSDIKCFDCKRKATTWRQHELCRIWYCAIHAKEDDNYIYVDIGYGNCGR